VQQKQPYSCNAEISKERIIKVTIREVKIRAKIKVIETNVVEMIQMACQMTRRTSQEEKEDSSTLFFHLSCPQRGFNVTSQNALSGEEYPGI